MRDPDEVAQVIALIGRGLSNSEIEAVTGIPRGTVSGWREGRAPNFARATTASGCQLCGDNALPEPEYAYLLGLYLGDGYINSEPRTYRLRIFMDAKYPKLNFECCQALQAVRPSKRAHVQQHSSGNCVVISMHWNHWPCVFPQHGPGRKHDRPILLARWQKLIVANQPEALLRGLIHSDGCRIIASDRGRPSVRYHFKNRSEDIKRIYCEALDLLKIPWTRPCESQIAVYRKAAAARMDEFIGPKE